MPKITQTNNANFFEVKANKLNRKRIGCVIHRCIVTYKILFYFDFVFVTCLYSKYTLIQKNNSVSVTKLHILLLLEADQ